MKKILKMLFAGILGLGFVACETYKADDPDMTAVSDFDGQWICFGYDASDTSTPVTVFVVEVTNTTFDDSDAMWMTIVDSDFPSVSGDSRFLDALRFKSSCDPGSLTFSCSSVDASQPNTCPNIYIYSMGAGYASYYTAAYQGFVPVDGYKVSVTNGKVIKNGIDTKTGYKADAIEFNYSRTNPDQTTKQYVVKGMKNTGWEEDMEDYTDFINANFNN